MSGPLETLVGLRLARGEDVERELRGLATVDREEAQAIAELLRGASAAKIGLIALEIALDTSNPKEGGAGASARISAAKLARECASEVEAALTRGG